MSGERLDDPNRQAVGVEPAWVEGTGGGAAPPEPPTEPPPEGDEEEPAPTLAGGTPTAEELDAMTKDELLALAQSLGISPANAAMTKGDIRASLDTYYAER